MIAALLISPAAAVEPPAVLKLLAKLNPPRNIDDATWASLTVAQRFRQYNYRLELGVLAVALLYLLFQVVTRRTNQRLVRRYVRGVRPLLRSEFAQVGIDAQHVVAKDSGCRYTLYATGRENIEGLVARIRLSDRYNLIPFVSGIFNPTLGSPDGLGDHVDITVRPLVKAKIPAGIFAVLNKEYINEFQESCHFFKLTKLSDNKRLPSTTFAVMQEHGEQAEKLLTPVLLDALALPGAARVLRFLAVSDLGVKEPETYADLEPEPVFTLSLSAPRSKEEHEAGARLVAALLGWVDTLVETPPYNSGAQKRIAANREEERAKITRALDAKKAEEVEQKKAEQRREAARKELALSEREQRALQKREQTKQARKQRQRMTRKA